MAEEVTVEDVMPDDYSYDDTEERKSIDEVVNQLLDEYDCIDWNSCRGKQQEIIRRLIDEFGFDMEEVADHFGYQVTAVKAMLARQRKLMRKEKKASGEEVDRTEQTKKPKKVNRKAVDVTDIIEDNVKVHYDEPETLDTDLGFSIEHPFAEYIPSKITVNNRAYTPEELVDEFGTAGLRLLKIQALLRVLRYGPAFRPPSKRFIKAIAQTLLPNSAIIDDYNTLHALLSNYRIEGSLISHAFSVLSYLDQQYRSLAESVDKFVPPVVSWMSIEKEGQMTFIPNQTPYPAANPYPFPSNGSSQFFPYNSQPSNPYPYPPQAYQPQPTQLYPFAPPAPQTFPPTPLPSPAPVAHIPQEVREELNKKDEEIEELKEAIHQLLEEKRLKEEEEREKKKLEMIKEIIDQKVGSIASRLSVIEQRLMSDSVDDDDREKELLEEIRKLKEEMTKKELDTLKSMIASLEKKLEESSKNPFPGSLNQYMVEFMIKQLETDAEIAKVREQSKTLEAIFDRMKDTLTKAADTFGRAFGREMVYRKVSEPKDDLVYTVCPICGAKFAYPSDDYLQVICPKCGYILLRKDKKTKETRSSDSKPPAKQDKTSKESKKEGKEEKSESGEATPLETPVEE